MHPSSYSLITIDMYFCMWYLLKHCPGKDRDTLCRSTACPAFPWPSNHYTLQSPLNFCLHSLNRVEVFIQPFLTLNDGHPHLSALGFVYLQPALAVITFHTSGASVVSCSALFCWRLQITKLFAMATCSNQKTYSSTTYTLSSWSHSCLCHNQPC